MKQLLRSLFPGMLLVAFFSTVLERRAEANPGSMSDLDIGFLYDVIGAPAGA